MRLRTIPTRLAAGAFIAHSGWEKWHGDEQTAGALHGMASGTYPQFKQMKPTDFLRMLSIGELSLGAALLAPFVPSGVAGAALVGFSGSLLNMYLKTPGLTKEGSIWPTPQGLTISKDVWMLGIGLGLVVDELTSRTK